MATKEQWIELLNLKLSGGDAPAQIQGKYSPQEIEHYLTMAFSDVLVAAWVQDPSMLNDYIKTKNLPVKFDASRNERYIDIYEDVLPLPNNSGVVQIKNPLNPNMQFDLLDINSPAVFTMLEVSIVNNVPGYYIEGQKAYFDSNLPPIVSNVLLKYITSFGGLSDTDEVIVPGGNNQPVFERVFQLMIKSIPSSNQDNMVDKQV